MIRVPVFLTESFQEKLLQFLAYAVCVGFTIAATAVSLNRHWQFETQYYDFGIFDTAIRKVAKFQPPLVDQTSFNGELKWIFADHVHPAIFLLSPLYWFTSRSEVLLIAQAVAVGASAFVLYLTSYAVLKDRFLSLAVLLSYVLFVGLQNAVITDFHEITVMALPMMLCYWALLTERKRAFIGFFLLTLLFKELQFVFGIGLACFVVLYRPAWRKIAALVGAASIAWGVVSIKLIIPYFAGHSSYQYLPEGTNGLSILSRLFWPFEKIKHAATILGSFLFLPLLALPTLPIILMNLGMRFLADSANKWGLGFHYNAELAPTLAISVVLAFAMLQKRLHKPVVLGIATVLILNSVVLYRFVLRGPLGLAYNRAFYAHTQNFQYLEDLVQKVPSSTTIMTQNNLASRFTDRDVFLLREEYQQISPEVIVLDLREGQSPNNYMGVSDPQDIVSALNIDPTYTLIYHEGQKYIFQKKAL